MNRILMISTGGTLASSHSDNGLSPGLHGNDILDKIEGLTAGFSVDVEELFMLDSSNMQPEEWTQLAARIYERRKDYDGLVVIHGTDTLAYTASAPCGQPGRPWRWRNVYAAKQVQHGGIFAETVSWYLH